MGTSRVVVYCVVLRRVARCWGEGRSTQGLWIIFLGVGSWAFSVEAFVSVWFPPVFLICDASCDKDPM